MVFEPPESAAKNSFSIKFTPFLCGIYILAFIFKM